MCGLGHMAPRLAAKATKAFESPAAEGAAPRDKAVGFNICSG